MRNPLREQMRTRTAWLGRPFILLYPSDRVSDHCSPPFQRGEPPPHHLLRLLLGAEGMAVLLVEFQVKGDDIVHGSGREIQPPHLAEALQYRPPEYLRR